MWKWRAASEKGMGEGGGRGSFRYFLSFAIDVTRPPISSQKVAESAQRSAIDGPVGGRWEVHAGAGGRRAPAVSWAAHARVSPARVAPARVASARIAPARVASWATWDGATRVDCQ